MQLNPNHPSILLVAVYCNRRLNHSSFVLLYYALFAVFELYLVCVICCTVLFVSISQVIGCEDQL